MKKLFALCLCAMLTGPTVIAQQPSDPRTFRVDVEAVEVDVRVLDAAGNPVAGLSASDFEVLEDGVHQDIKTFTPVSIGTVPRARQISVEPDTQTNQVAADGRIYVFVLDDLHTHPLRSHRTRAVVRQFLDRHVGANDRVAIVTTSGRTEAAQELTTSRAALLTALDAFHGRKLRASTLERIGEYYRLRSIGEERDRNERIDDPLEQERVYNARQTLTTLRNVGRWLDQVPARRKAVLLVSEGIDYDIQDFITNRFASDVLTGVQDAVASAARSNANIYAIDPRGLAGIGDETIEVSSLPDDTTGLGSGAFLNWLRMTQDSLRVLADQTGGFALVNTNDLDGGLARLVRENSDYYLLAYQPTNTRRDGRFRRLEVRVNRPGVRVVTRSGYYAQKADDRAPESAIAGEAALRALIDSPIPMPGMPLATAVTTFRGGKDKASVLVTAEVGPGFVLQEKDSEHHGRVELALVALDMEGAIAASEQKNMDLKLRPATRDAVVRHGVRTTTRLELKPGRYQLRLAARDANGPGTGSVIHDIIVPDFAQSPVAMSQLLLASRGAMRTATTNIDAALKDVLQAPPTTARQFDRRDILSVFAEVYDNRKGHTSPVAVTTSVADAGGRVVFRSEESVEGSAFDSSRRAYRHTASVPLDDLAPGEYVLRVEAQSRVGNERATVREVAFSVRDAQMVAE